MIRVEHVSVTVSVEGDASEGERAFARLFDKYQRIHSERADGERAHAARMARDRRLPGRGGR